MLNDCEETKYSCIFYIFSYTWDCTCNWNFSSWRKGLGSQTENLGRVPMKNKHFQCFHHRDKAVTELSHLCIENSHTLNSSPPSVSFMCQSIGSALVQITACRLCGTNPLSTPMLGNCQLDPQEQISVNFESKYKTFHSRKCIWKYRLCEMVAILSRERWVKHVHIEAASCVWELEQTITFITTTGNKYGKPLERTSGMKIEH